jgi:hypothetical protein
MCCWASLKKRSYIIEGANAIEDGNASDDLAYPPMRTSRLRALLRGNGSASSEDTASLLDGLREVLVQPRVLTALVLILGGLVWAFARGLEFYGLSPVHVAYDLDQPPLLVILVAVWLLYRSWLR